MTIKLHDLRPAPGSKTARTRVGRGEGSKGKTAGRGTKGTKARKHVPATFEGGQMPIHMRLPKLKGFRNRFRTEYEVVNVGDINRLFPQGGSVGVDDLVAKGAVRKNSLVKVLGDGKLTVKVDVSAHKFSGSAREKITAAGARRPSCDQPSCGITSAARRSICSRFSATSTPTGLSSSISAPASITSAQPAGDVVGCAGHRHRHRCRASCRRCAAARRAHGRGPGPRRRRPSGRPACRW